MQIKQPRRLLSSFICLLLLLNASRGVVLCVGSAGHVALESAHHNHHGNCPHNAQFPLDTPSSSPSSRPNDHPSAPNTAPAHHATCSQDRPSALDPAADHDESCSEHHPSAAGADHTCSHDQPSTADSVPGAHDTCDRDSRIAIHPDPHFQPTECTPCVDIPFWLALANTNSAPPKAKFFSQTALCPAPPEACLSTALAPFTNSTAAPLPTSFFQPLNTIIIIA